MLEIKERNLEGILAENFVYIYLRDRLGKDFIGDEVMTFSEPKS